MNVSVKKPSIILLIALMVIGGIAPAFAVPNLVYAEEQEGKPEIIYIDEETGEPIDLTEENVNAPPEEVIVPDLDYSSMRLITNADSEVLEGEPVISEYDGMSILQYESEEDAMIAFAKISESADVEVDSVFEIQDDLVPVEVTEEPELMTEDENPLTELENAIDEMDSVQYDVAVIDTGATDADKIVSMLGDDGLDNNGHGQLMIDTIKAEAPDAKVLSIKAIKDNGTGDASAVYAAIKYAIEEGVSVINLSISAPATEDSFIVEEAINEALEKGIIVVGAAGNNASDASDFIPGRIEGAIIVGSTSPASNFGDTVDYVIESTSTSFAAAKAVGFYLANSTFDGVEENFKVDRDIDTSNPVDIKVLAKYLYVDYTMVDESDTFESVIFDKDAEPILIQKYEWLTVYEQEDETYMAPITSPFNNGLSRGNVIDYAVARGNDWGETIETGWNYDTENNVLTFSAEALEGVDEYDFSDLQIQLMIPGSTDKVIVPIAVSDELGLSPLGGVYEYSAFGNIEVQLMYGNDADSITYRNLDVYVNDERISGCVYDTETGVLSIPVIAVDVRSIYIQIHETPYTMFEIAGKTVNSFSGSWLALPDGTNISSLTKGRTWSETAKNLFTGEKGYLKKSNADSGYTGIDWSASKVFGSEYTDGGALDIGNATYQALQLGAVSLSTSFGGVNNFILQGRLQNSSGTSSGTPTSGWNYGILGMCYHISASRSYHRGNENFLFKVEDVQKKSDGYTYVVISFLQNEYKSSGTSSGTADQITGGYFGFKVKAYEPPTTGTGRIIKNVLGNNADSAAPGRYTFSFKHTDGTSKTLYVDIPNGWTTASGELTDLKPGTWTITETSAPSGVEKYTGPTTMTITAGKTTSITWKNTANVDKPDDPPDAPSVPKPKTDTLDVYVYKTVTGSNAASAAPGKYVFDIVDAFDLSTVHGTITLTIPSGQTSALGGPLTLTVYQNASYVEGKGNIKWSDALGVIERECPSGITQKIGNRYNGYNGVLAGWDARAYLDTGLVMNLENKAGSDIDEPYYPSDPTPDPDPITARIQLRKFNNPGYSSMVTEAYGSMFRSSNSYVNGQLTTVYRYSGGTPSKINNQTYTLAGAVYGVYSDEACTKQVDTITTGTGYSNSGGYGTVSSLEAGINNLYTYGTSKTFYDDKDELKQYFIKEITPSAGYQLDETVYTVTLTEGTNYVNVKEIPIPPTKTSYTAALRVDKTVETGHSAAGAKYGVYATSADADGNKNALATLTIGSDGKSNLYTTTLDSVDASKLVYVKEISGPTEALTDAAWGLDPFIYPVELDVYSTEDNPEVVNSSDEIVYAAHIKIQKTSANPNITNGNSCYSLAGAQFGIYSTMAQATAGGTAGRIQVLTTDASGNTPESDDLDDGTYYVRELVAPKGYVLDTTVKSITVAKGQTGTVTFADKPGTDPVGITVVKKSSTGETVADVSATFKVEYFENLTTTGTATRTWYFKTVNGNIKFDEAHLDNNYTNSALYKLSDGTVSYPIGSLKITEEKAPVGYKKTNATYTGKIEQASSDTDPEWSWLSPTNMSGKVTIEIENEKIFSGIKVQKIDAGFGTSAAQGNGTLQGAKIGIYNNSGKTIVLKNKTSVANGGLITTLTTNTSGEAQSAVDLLPVGKYYAKEIEAPTGYLINNNQFAFEITETNPGENKVLTLSTKITETIKTGTVKIEKWDKDLNRKVAQGDADFSGIQFEITNKSTNPVKVNNNTIAVDSVVMTLTTNAAGDADSGKVLPYGTYQIKEKATNGTYALTDGTARTFNITEDGQTQFTDTSSNSLVFKDSVNRGDVQIEKWDSELNRKAAQGDATLAGIQFDIINKSAKPVYVDGKEYAVNAVVKTITTDANGVAKTTGKTLPVGTYEVKEKATNTSYLLSDTSTKTFKITTNGSTVTKDTSGNDLVFKDRVVRGGIEIVKFDAEKKAQAAQGDADFAGIKFEVTNKSNQVVKVNGTEYAKDKVVLTLTTDAAGKASAAANTLPYGTYEIKEVEGNDGYRLTDGTARTFQIRNEGQIVKDTIANERMVFSNLVKRGGVKLTKVDLGTGKNTPQGDALLSGAEITIYNNSNQSVIVGGTEYAKGAAVATITTDASGNSTTTKETLPYGTYYAKETKAATGYKLNSSWRTDFTVRYDGVIVDKTTDKLTQDVMKGTISIVKKDAVSSDGKAQGNSTLGGIRYAIVNRSAESVIVNSAERAKGQVVAILTTNSDGKASISNIPYGTYEVFELRNDATIAVGEVYDTSNKLGDSVFVNEDGYILDEDHISETVQIRSDGQTVTANFENILATGGVKVGKSDNDTKKVTPQGNATFEGAEFTIYNGNTRNVVVEGKEYAPNAAVKTIVTGADGTFETEDDLLPYGNYYVKETKAPTGYLLDTDYRADIQIREYKVIADLTTNDMKVTQADKYKTGWYSVVANGYNLNAANTPEKVQRGEAKIMKNDSELNAHNSQGDADFAGIRYAIVNRSKASVVVDGVEQEVGKVVKIVTLNASGEGTTGAKVLPFGTYDVIELTANSTSKAGDTWKASDTGNSIYANNNGYLYTAKTVSITIDKDGDVKTADFEDKPLRGGVKVGKIDLETGKPEPQGWATLEGAEITIYNASKKPVIVDGKSIAVGGEILTLTTDKNGLASTANNVLPYGTYTAKETKAPEGYVLNKDWSVTFQVRWNGDIADTTVNDTVTAQIGADAKTGVTTSENVHATNKHEVPDQIARMDLKFFKTDIDGKVMGYIPFLVSRLDENGKVVEQHVIVSDETGNIDTSMSNKNSAKTNSLDQYVKGGKFTDESKLDPEVNIWFGEQSAKNNNGSLIYANYLIEELQVEANKGMDLLKQYVFADGDNKPYEELFGYFEHGGVRNLSNVFVNLIIHPASDLIDDESGTKIATFGEEVTVTDTFSYDHLKIDQNYKLETEIFYVDRDGNKSKLGETMSDVWNPVKSDPNRTARGSVSNTVTLNTKDLEGGTLNAVDTLYGEINGDFVELTKHNANLDTESQKLYVPWMKTNAADVKTGDHVGTSLTDAEVVDIVTYENLGDQRMYLFRAELLDNKTGEPIKGLDGKDLVVEKVLRVDWTKDGMSERTYGTLGPKDGEVEMPAFKLDGTIYQGKTVVVKETLIDYDSDRVILVHDELADEDQSVHYPKVSTEASDVNTEAHTGVVGETLVKDIVTIENTIPGQEYTVTGKLVYQADGTDSDGNNFKKGDVIAEHAGVTVIAKSETTVVELTFEVDASKLEGVSGVVFEDLYHNNVLVAIHHDIDDEAQTINFPKVRTTAVDSETKSHAGVVGEEAYIIDTVELTNLTVGENYKVRGTLMNTDGTVFKQDGKEITVESEVFTADNADMTKELTFKFDSSLLAGQSLVVYEKLLFVKGTPDNPGEEVEVARHEDPNDPDQTVDYPEIRTNATDSKTSDEVGTVGHEEVIIDKVTYTNLRVGETYTITGDLHYKEDGEGHSAGDKVLDKDGNPYTAEVTFEAETKDGYILLTYHVDSELLRGQSVVVFEDLHNNGVKIHTHSDLEDEDQRIDYPEVKTQAYSKKTGDHVGDTDEETVIVDIVRLSNLTVGRKYKVAGVLMDKETASPVLDKDGNAVETISDEFEATSKDMEIEIEFTLDGTARAARTTVAYEQLIHNDVVVSYHCDIDDFDQSIFTPKIETNAMDAETDAQVGRPREETIIIDTVKYENLLPGMLYKIEGVLMVRETGEIYHDADGNEVRSESQPFTVEEGKESGEIDLKFVFNGSNLKGTTLVVFEDMLHNGVTVTAHHDITDEKQSVDYPDGYTEAKDAKTETHMTNAAVDAVVVDTFYYNHLTPGLEYTLQGKLVDKETEEVIAVNEVKFTPEARDGKVELEFTFDASQLAGKSLVAFERVLHKTIPVIVHEDPNDEDQTIVIPKIGTVAKDKADNDNHVLDAKEQVIVDTIKYENLVPSAEYHAYLTVYDKTTGELTDVTADRVFTSSETGTGEIEVEVTIDGTIYAGHSLVMFERVYVSTMDKPEPVEPKDDEEPVEPNDNPVGTHEDPTDPDQTIYVPKIGTVASDKADGDKAILDKEGQVITDTVKYEGLEPGREYKLTATVYDKTVKTLTDVTAESTFKASESGDGETVIEIPIDGSKYAGHILVMYERVSTLPDGDNPGNEVGRHENPDDPDQTINVPKIGTTASDLSDGDNIIYNKDKVTIVDTVRFEGLPLGKYKVVLTVMDKATGQPLKSTVNAVPITHTDWVEVTVEDGAFDMAITLGSEITKGHTLVMFEEMYLDNNLVAEHKDLNDAPQTVYAPDAKTVLTADGKKEVTASEKTELIDTIKYTNLIPGIEYTAIGDLIVKDTDEVIGTASAKFTPTASDGEVKITFTVDTSKISGKSVVAFEKITYEKDGKPYDVCEHKDKNDKDQTVVIKAPVKSVDTGDTTNFIPFLAFILIALATAIVVRIRIRRA